MTAATLDRPPGLLDGYRWIHAVGLTYCVAVAAWSAGSYLVEGLPGRAIICVGAQFVGLALAILSRRAMASRAPVLGVALWVPAAACCAVAALGIQHAWTRQGGDLVYAAALIVAAIELIVFVSADHVAEAEAAARRAQSMSARESEAEAAARAIEAEHRRRLELIQAGPVMASPEPVRQPTAQPSRNRGRAAAAALALVPAAVGCASAPPAIISDATPGRSIDDVARDLIASGVTTRRALIDGVRAATNSGIGSGRAQEYLDRFSPGWRTRQA